MHRESRRDGAPERELRTVRVSDITPLPPPTCPTCGGPMPYRGGTYGFVCCEWKLLHRAGGWFDEHDRPVRDRRIRDL